MDNARLAALSDGTAFAYPPEKIATINRILEDLVQVLQPKTLEVTGRFTARGGLTTEVRAGYEAGA